MAALILLIVVLVAMFAAGVWLGYEYTIQRAEEWIEDHMATEHPPC